MRTVKVVIFFFLQTYYFSKRKENKPISLQNVGNICRGRTYYYFPSFLPTLQPDVVIWDFSPIRE